MVLCRLWLGLLNMVRLLVSIAPNVCIYAAFATLCQQKNNNMENNFRFVSITKYAKLCCITREAVYKRIKSGKAKLFELSEPPIIDLAFSKGTDNRFTWKEITPE